MELTVRILGYVFSLYVGADTDDTDTAEVDGGPALTLVDGGPTDVELGFRTPALWDDDGDDE